LSYVVVNFSAEDIRLDMNEDIVDDP